MGPKKTNSKAEAGRARKTEQDGIKSAKAAAAQEAEIAKDWQKGANKRGQQRADDEAAKADEALRKKQEKAALLAAEEAELGSGGKPKKGPTLSKKGNKKNDLSLLEDSLVSEAEKKAKAKKRADQAKKEKEAAAVKAKQEASEVPVDPLLQNTDAMLSGAVGRAANVEAMEGTTSGLDGALASLNMGKSDVKRQKALYLAFEEKTLSTVKADNPGLRLTQYKEKVFAMWKKSAENPQNQAP